MILFWLVLIPFIGGVAGWVLGRNRPNWARWTSLMAISLDLALALLLWAQSGSQVSLIGGSWLAEMEWSWIPQLGIRFHLAIDGLSLLMVLLTGVLGIISVAVSWSEITERVGFFHLSLMWVLSGVIGVFLAMDLFLFYFFWELMLVPMYFLIDVWGHENRHYAAVKFFLFTQLSGLLMLLAILGLYFIHGRATGRYSFDYFDLLHTPVALGTARWLMLGFFVAFAVKLPAVPLHTWLPDAHTQAPTAGSVILAGLLLKTGAYGLLRFAVPLFPQASHEFAPVAMVLGVVGILYGAWLAFGQSDLKRLVAYTSVSHLGFVLLGIYAWNSLALQGAVMQMICHGLSTGALFVMAGLLQDRLQSREMDRMGGLWAAAPRFGACMMFFAMASLGLPGLGNFVAEFLALLGAFKASVTLTALATLGLVAATVYSLWLMQRSFLGPRTSDAPFADLNVRELAMMIALVVPLVWLGVLPQTVLDTAEPSLNQLQRSASTEVRTSEASSPEVPDQLAPGGSRGSKVQPCSTPCYRRGLVQLSQCDGGGQ